MVFGNGSKYTGSPLVNMSLPCALPFLASLLRNLDPRKSA